jgi:hypothetical protein
VIAVPVIELRGNTVGGDIDRAVRIIAGIGRAWRNGEAA